MVGEQDCPQFGQLLRRILERGEHDRLLIEREREQLHRVEGCSLEPIGQRVSPDMTDEARELWDGIGGDGEAVEHHPTSYAAAALRDAVSRSREG